MAASTWVAILAIAIPLSYVIWLWEVKFAFRIVGWILKFQGDDRRGAIAAKVSKDRNAVAAEQHSSVEAEDGWEKIESTGSAENGKSPQDSWDGIVGFFHPFCNAGGGGERVLWAAIAATQRRWPNAVCAVYTGDHDIDRSVVVSTVKNRFDISLQEHSLVFIYLARRRFVLATTYPSFTLLGQSLGSMILAFEAFQLLVPDIFIDTMGYAFAVALCKYLFPTVPTAAYVHYPTISTDMLESLADVTGSKGIHSGSGQGLRGMGKKVYWQIFAKMYGWTGRQIDIVMCNSTWTQGHIRQLWKPRTRSSSFAAVVYPPCPVEELEAKIKINPYSEKEREDSILYIAQFRPEKNHSLILRAFAKYYHSSQNQPKLVLIGSVRSNTPDERHVYNLRLEARELKITDAVSFICDAPFTVILKHLQKSSIVTNGMYSEHFGIGNVEGLAAGLIPVVHNSGGPRLDIVVPFEGKTIGYLAETDQEYAQSFHKVASLDAPERYAMRLRGRASTHRFTEAAFAEKWIRQMEALVEMERSRSSG